MNIENLSTLKIHKLTQEQYDRALAEGNIDPNAIYLTPESSVKGVSPHIGDNGNWWIGDEDTGVAATAGAEAADAAAERAESQALLAGNSANDAASSASEASGYATSASRASSNANTAMTNAETAATNAANSASSASSSASTATTQANNAKNSASAAATSASQASTSATQAGTSASEAGTAANTAKGYRDEVKNMLDNAVIDPSEAVLVTSQNLTNTQKVTARENIGAASQADLEALNSEKADKTYVEETVADLPNDEMLIANVAEVVKAEVPLVKTAEHPTFVNSVDEMTDTSKVYLMPDGYIYASVLKEDAGRNLTVDDFVIGGLQSADGTDASVTNRARTSQIECTVQRPISITCNVNSVKWLVHFFKNGQWIGKTSMVSTNSADVTALYATPSDVTHVRILLGYTNDGKVTDLADLVGKFTITQAGQGLISEWTNTGLAYNQPAGYEDRIVALEKALGGIVYGTY